MHELLWGTAFLAGLLGSGHCVAMCGGIATALGAAPGTAARASNALLYQIGRISSYALVGGLAGALGNAAGVGFETATWSVVLRLAAAILVIVIGLDMALDGRARPRWLRAPERWGARMWRKVAPATRARLPEQPAARALALGLIWGWLPCGLVYSALLAAAVSGGALAGGATMIAFGLGTLPAMASLSYLGTRWAPRSRTFAQIAGGVIVACGIWTAATPIAALGGAAPHAHDHSHMHMHMH